MEAHAEPTSAQGEPTIRWAGLGGAYQGYYLSRKKT
jgi:hypothetical protein